MRAKRKIEGTASGTEARSGGLPREELAFHLKALRKVLIISLGGIAAVFLVVFLGFSREVMNFLEEPIKSRGIELIFISLHEPIFIQMKAAFMVSVIIVSPLILAQVWSFIKPALYPREGRFVALMFFITLALFLLGALFAYLIVFQMAVTFFLGSGEGIAQPFISIERYVNFLAGFVLPFGLVFETPIVMAVLTLSGLVKASTFSRLRKYIIFGIFVIAAVLTPPDVVSQVLLALPLVVLFEAGIIVSRIVQKRRNKSGDKT
ncbi:MAG: twin-arginine translocase subunit TatC [Treponema sp.]|jgi:sec-independent protein translocase protein TatC|nr:twin-arginine translocase subunit TatC [Treponema sp.]